MVGKLKIMVCCHKPSVVPRREFLLPVQVGAALAEGRFEGFVQDNEGINISGKNRSYCELTALYWAWKNLDAGHVGLFHYRRYLYPDPEAKLPYRICEQPDDRTMDLLHMNAITDLAAQYDFVLPVGEDMHVPVREHYANAPFHRAEDLVLTEQILQNRFPEYIPAMEEYLSGTVCYFGNILIMRASVLDDYCRWLFTILEEFDCRANWEGRNAQELRVDGYLAERLLGIYYTKNRQQLKTLELPRVHFEPEAKLRHRIQFVNFLLPPGSKRRAGIKAVRKR